MMLFLLLALHLSAVFAFPLERDLSSDPPTVTLDSATVTGIHQGNLTKFLGIPFAQPPTGSLRFQLPQAITFYNGSINATDYGPICPQQAAPFPVSIRDFFNFSLPFSFGDFFPNRTNSTVPTPESEDCLTINVIKPTNVSADAKLPVLVWIFGGGFQRGSAFGYDRTATRIVNRSMELGEPVIYAAMNYRVSAWGFLASKEVQEVDAGNAGLVDQRVALEWVQKYIGNFGGDPSKVTIWGQSAGAISVSLQMLAYGGNSSNLFRGAFMQSGAPIPVGNITGGQVYYDSLVNQTNCSDSNNTFTCLQQVPLDTLQAAVNNTPNYFSYQALALAWSPRADGVFLQDNPQRLVQQGKVTNVPFVTGNVDDEGTLFSLSSLNVTTDEQFEAYISTTFVPGADESTLEPLWSYYPPEEPYGSPFNTSDRNAVTPQYKRIAAFQGDVTFQAPRRFFMQHLLANSTSSGETQKMWGYLSKKLKFTPIIGSFHISDLDIGLLDDYIIYFTYNLDPNLPDATDSTSNITLPFGLGSLLPGQPRWPEYTTEAPRLYTFPILGDRPDISNDTYREAPMQYLMNLSLAHPL
ncbi:unnamed protein product [Cyclocybe aegerita]|uniref:Carboxylic ester hydrolase n=1 Tax=Cyclocybe aegerita TaxID=1973307 RepID=A0A8S0WT24_CYCAE|nr:unnamed protein product [Cyclocybe aegerita]